MNADNYVGLTAFGTYVVVVGAEVVGEFLSQAEAEQAFKARTGAGVVARPEDTTAPMQAPCGQGEPAPVVGGYWACVDGYWQPTTQSDPRAQANPPAPRPGTAPVSPESGLPPAASAPPAVVPVVTLGAIAGRLGTSRGGLLVAGGIVAAAWLLR